MKNNKYQEALDEIKKNYDASYFVNNGYDFEFNTHKEQFELLATLPGLSLEKGALYWILHRYYCNYKHFFEDETGTAFEYIRNIINEVIE